MARPGPRGGDAGAVIAIQRTISLVTARLTALARWQAPWVLSILAILLNSVWAQTPVVGEYQVKAAFVYNFAKFVEWPSRSFPDASAPLRICVFGLDPFGDELRGVANDKVVNGRRLQVSHAADLQAARTCHILFISSSEKGQLKSILQSLRGSDALTVGDTEGFTEQGGMINLVLEKNRVQFEVNRKAAEEAGLKLSSRLLSLAKNVIV